jgi:transaldolase/glucose-6-phosphate isomerase
MNPLKKLLGCGQSFWLDYIRRSLITTGELKRLIDEDGLRGITSNPTIFQKAIAGSTDYDNIIRESVKEDPNMEVSTLFEKLAIEDIQLAADILRQVYDSTQGGDGFVSYELPPHLANDTEGSIKEARRLWEIIDRPNIMLKVPATREGIPVIETLIAECINVNVTLIFSVDHYNAVADAYIRGLERCAHPNRVASVASFFLSRIDRAVNKFLEEDNSQQALSLRGQIAISNAKKAYKSFKEKFGGERWKQLAERGARVQRVLWASTSTKNLDYSDVMYVEEIIGPLTVNTLPPVTLNAFRDHGKVRPTLEKGVEEAEDLLKRLAERKIDLNAITEKLQKDGVEAFSNSYDDVLSSLSQKINSILKRQSDLRHMNLGIYQKFVDKRLKELKESNFLSRLWKKDPTLWFPDPVNETKDRLGWLDLLEVKHTYLDDFQSFAEEIKNEGILHVVQKVSWS